MKKHHELHKYLKRALLCRNPGDKMPILYMDGMRASLAETAWPALPANQCNC
jgi:hypothetical protein